MISPPLQSSKSPAVSVIIPTYNRSEYVVRAVESILRQSFRDCELIVIDDGSTDDTRAQLAQYMDRIRYVYQPNRGATAAQNAGLEQAQGSWIGILGSDDEWHPAMLASQMQALRALDGQVRVCFSDCRFKGAIGLDTTAFQLSRMPSHEDFGIIAKPLRYIVGDKYALYVQGMIVSADLMREIGGFDERLHLGEDQDLIFRLSYKTAFGYVSQPLATIDRSPSIPRLTDLYNSRSNLRSENEAYRLLKLLSQPELTDADVRQALEEELVRLYYDWAATDLQSANFSGAFRRVSELHKLGEKNAKVFRALLSRGAQKLARSMVGTSLAKGRSAHA